MAKTDFLLVDYVRKVYENPTDNLAVILCCGGLLIQGDIITHDEFADILDGKPFDPAAAIERHSNDKEEAKGYLPEPQFIHLKNAALLMSNKTYHVNTWRGRLSSIDGFSFGSFSLNDNGIEQDGDESPQPLPE